MEKKAGDKSTTKPLEGETREKVPSLEKMLLDLRFTERKGDPCGFSKFRQLGAVHIPVCPGHLLG